MDIPSRLLARKARSLPEARLSRSESSYGGLKKVIDGPVFKRHDQAIEPPMLNSQLRSAVFTD